MNRTDQHNDALFTPPTPFLRLDVGAAVSNYKRLRDALPGTAVHYAIKANNDPELLAALSGAGCDFDVASPSEVDDIVAAGADARTVVYSNPIKRRADIAAAAARGVRLFAVDSIEETVKVAEAAPGTDVLCRLVTSGAGSDWPLSRKYGCSTSQAVEILKTAAGLGLGAAGVSFHVGSQQRDPLAWREPIAASARVFGALRGQGISPWLVDLGGGFPAALEGDTPPIAEYGKAVGAALAESFGTDLPRTIIEPGRAVVADAGVLESSVVAVVNRGGTRWVFLDAGVFTGLVETIEEAIRYPLTTTADGGPVGPCVLAGPTCDSADVLYEKNPVMLPLALAEGDIVRFSSAGAYTTCYSTVGFNGFPPLATHHVTARRRGGYEAGTGASAARRKASSSARSWRRPAIDGSHPTVRNASGSVATPVTVA